MTEKTVRALYTSERPGKQAEGHIGMRVPTYSCFSIYLSALALTLPPDCKCLSFGGLALMTPPPGSLPRTSFGNPSPDTIGTPDPAHPLEAGPAFPSQWNKHFLNTCYV